jgi:hypothetical protein
MISSPRFVVRTLVLRRCGLKSSLQTNVKKVGWVQMISSPRFVVRTLVLRRCGLKSSLQTNVKKVGWVQRINKKPRLSVIVQNYWAPIFIFIATATSGADINNLMNRADIR